ncbi:MAG: hypothetical protein G01um101470_242 [Parcubacteria group bacterium Gr01-1014_70]|nr:MAG: hypothetical protein G01um101470_242 [Parcubacteria group bacterium Gr01-1014_70]
MAKNVNQVTVYFVSGEHKALEGAEAQEFLRQYKTVKTLSIKIVKSRFVQEIGKHVSETTFIERRNIQWVHSEECL